jgi:hypothetical protein
MSMSNDNSSESTGRILYQSEIFKDGPKTGDNYSSSIGAEQGLEVFGGEKTSRRRQRPAKTHLEPAREIPVFAETEVLVVGGGPAGTAAAISAARLGADVLLVERYNHLGGLSTGGLVIWIDRMSDWAGKHIIRGFASDRNNLTGAQKMQRLLPTGRNGRQRSTALSPGRPQSIRKR